MADSQEQQEFQTDTKAEEREETRQKETSQEKKPVEKKQTQEEEQADDGQQGRESHRDTHSGQAQTETDREVSQSPTHESSKSKSKSVKFTTNKTATDENSGEKSETEVKEKNDNDNRKETPQKVEEKEAPHKVEEKEAPQNVEEKERQSDGNKANDEGTTENVKQEERETAKTEEKVAEKDNENTKTSNKGKTRPVQSDAARETNQPNSSKSDNSSKSKNENSAKTSNSNTTTKTSKSKSAEPATSEKKEEEKNEENGDDTKKDKSKNDKLGIQRSRSNLEMSEGRTKQKEFFKLELARLENSLKRESSKIVAPEKKPYTPYVFNKLEPYYNTQITRYLIELPDEVRHGHTSRRTAQGLTDPWLDLKMDRECLPLVNSKPVSRQVAILKKEKEIRDRKKRSAMSQSSKKEGSTRLPKFPMVHLETQDLATKQLFYSDVPALRQELKTKYSSSARTKVDEDYKRTHQDFYRMELNKLDEVHPINRRHMRSAYFAYLQNTPGSKKAITECVRGLNSGKAQ